MKRVAPEAAAAPGVVYTPAWLAAHVAAAALDPLVAGRDLDGLLALRLLDPACGDGSLLLAALARLERAALAYLDRHPRGAGRWRDGDRLRPALV
ncbi:MAG: hypothetical protein KC636_00915, partial [Myxococcales bacterium]|nr:hypothetical protein [Myxococcales bacterium]